MKHCECVTDPTYLEFHVFSLKVFRRWESNFRKRYIAKGKLSEIVETYLEFFEFIGDKGVVQYLRQMCLEAPTQNVPTCESHDRSQCCTCSATPC
jgi:hypothetical protein